MPNPIVLGNPATCGHLATGGSTVNIEGKPAMLVGLGIAGGPIIGPGSALSKVLIQNTPVSLVGDSITPHGEPPHSSPKFVVSIAPTVNIG